MSSSTMWNNDSSGCVVNGIRVGSATVSIRIMTIDRAGDFDIRMD